MAHIKPIAMLAGLAAAATFTATPAQAAELTPGATSSAAVTAAQMDFNRGGAFDTSIYNSAAETSEYRRRRWRGYRRYRRNRIDGGDVLAGVLILGGIAAIASAASNNNRDRDRYRDRRYERREDNRRYDDRRRSNPRSSSGSGLDSAVSQCMTEIERDVRVDSVDNASRTATGWTVTGTLFNGTGFSCQIDNNGRISNVDYSGFSGGALGAVDGQYSDQSYADARASQGGTGYAGPAPVTRDADREPQPAYPGGPLPGETYSD